MLPVGCVGLEAAAWFDELVSETFNHGSWSWFASCFQVVLVVSFDPNSFASRTIRSWKSARQVKL